MDAFMVFLPMMVLSAMMVVVVAWRMTMVFFLAGVPPVVEVTEAVAATFLPMM